ncbi:MAG: ATP-binding cassette domain-containing protein [Gordonibacter pamelaeae]
MATAMIMLLLSAATLVVANLLNRPVGATRVGPGRKAAKREPGMAGSIEVRDLRVERGSFVLEVPRLSVRPREVFAILGSTGSGKTVLMESIAGAFPLDGGCILLDGKDVESLPVQQRHLGILYQDYALFPHMTVRENIAYGLRMNGCPPRERDERVQAMLSLFDIGHLAERYPGIISGGESRRTRAGPRLGAGAGDTAARRTVLGVGPGHEGASVRHAARCACAVRLHHRVRHPRLQRGPHAGRRVGVVLDGRVRAVREACALFEPEGLEPEVQTFLGLRYPGSATSPSSSSRRPLR